MNMYVWCVETASAAIILNGYIDVCDRRSVYCDYWLSHVLSDNCQYSVLFFSVYASSKARLL